MPTNDQLLAAAASLINANQILANNPHLANYQTLSGIINNNSNHTLPLNNNLNKPLGFMPINSLSSLPTLPNAVNPNVLQTNPILNPVANIPIATNQAANNAPNNQLNFLQPTNQIRPKNQPNIIPDQPVNLNANKNLLNLNNNANSAFEISSEDTNSSLINESNPNYSLNVGENSMPEHWKLLINGMQKFSLSLIKSLHNFEPRDSSTGIILSPFCKFAVEIYNN